ncbi:acyltransferase family protein [Acinetobacter sp. YH12140]|uniref:acyltransferase family protein n=1 Tax=Acinetobacter sp. YH12140 TaxID=2601124 RepID=UPI0015D1E26C|nr:acyltransferase family protein [Acinetobacter sp. YH12140]
MSSNFRYDINGLRAYAVAFVVLFHFNIFGFSGGFVGVDIFFVISGLLMTKIIVKGLEKDSFNFIKFYLSRANRIIPALAVLITIIGVIGWFTLLPQEFKDYSQHSIASLSFLSNIQYFRESGYFDAVSHEKLLLHTWSLSVEWQFYIILPIFLFITGKLVKNLNSLKIVYLIGFLSSLLLSIYFTKNYASASFYLLPTRAWEMMAGGLIFLYFDKIQLKNHTKNVLEKTGFILIFLSLFLFTGKTLWPSYNALVPVIGTFLILLANNNSFFTNNKAAQFLGNTSYSIYLWHWPIVFYLAYFEKSSSIFFSCCAIILSVVLGWISYKFIENPTRKYLSNLSIFKNCAATLIYIFIPIALLSFIYVNNGLPNRLSEDVKQTTTKNAERNPRFNECQPSSGSNLPECHYGKGEIKLLVIGDSHAEAMMQAVQSSLPVESAALDWTYSGCPTVKNIKKINSPDFKCDEAISYYLKKSVSSYPNAKVLIINRTNVLFHGAADGDPTIDKPIRYISKPSESYDQNYHQTMKAAHIETLCEFAKNHEVYVTRPVPEFPVNVPKVLGHRLILNNKEKITISKDDYMSRSKLTFEAQDEANKKCGVHILDTTKYFCDEEKCYSDKKGIPFYFDDDHLSVYGAEQLIPLFKEVFK